VQGRLLLTAGPEDAAGRGQMSSPGVTPYPCHKIQQIAGGRRAPLPANRRQTRDCSTNQVSIDALSDWADE
jgi:hypothetical protein